MTARTRTVRLLTVMAIGVPAMAAAQDTGVQPTVFVSVRTLNAEGTRARDAAIDRAMKPGDVATHYLFAGRAHDPDGSICSLAASDADAPLLSQRLHDALHVWKITVSSLSYEAGQHTLDLDWQRRTSGNVARAGKVRVALAEDQSYTLDLIHTTASGGCRAPGIVVEVTARAKEDPVLADTVLKYDLWLVRQDDTGRKDTRHLVLTGVQGHAISFQFSPLASAVPKLQADQDDFRVATRVRGSLRGRLTREGQVVIELETQRLDRLERISDVPFSPPPRSGGGRKVLTALPGEAIEIQLPGRSGRTSAAINDREAARIRSGVRAAETSPPHTEPVTLHDGRLTVNYGPFFGRERLSLIVQVRKADDAQQ